MRDEYNPFAGLQSGYDLILGREPVRDFRGQIPRPPELLDVLLRDGGGLPLALRARSGHDWRGWRRWERLKLGRWSLRMGKQEKEEGVGKKRGLNPLI